MVVYFRCQCSSFNTRETIYETGISCWSKEPPFVCERGLWDKDVKAGAPLVRVFGEWHEGHECCCQSLLAVHRLFFKAPACLSALWRRRRRRGPLRRHALGSSKHKDDFTLFFKRVGYFDFCMLIQRITPAGGQSDTRWSLSDYNLSTTVAAQNTTPLPTSKALEETFQWGTA